MRGEPQGGPSHEITARTATGCVGPHRKQRGNGKETKKIHAPSYGAPVEKQDRTTGAGPTVFSLCQRTLGRAGNVIENLCSKSLLSTNENFRLVEECKSTIQVVLGWTSLGAREADNPLAPSSVSTWRKRAFKPFRYENIRTFQRLLIGNTVSNTQLR